MSQKLIKGSITTYPSLPVVSAAQVSSTLNASGEAAHHTGYIILEDPTSAAKTISAAGGGSITWMSAAVTNANAGTVFKVGIQDVSTTTAPAQGDGVFDVVTTYTGAGAIAANTVVTSVMATGTKSISNGQLISIVFEMTTLGGADSITVRSNGSSTLARICTLPTVTDNTTGSFVAVTNVVPNAFIIFDDGTTGWFYGCPFYSNTGNQLSYNSTTALADEYANIILNTVPVVSVGATVYINSTTTAADYEILLYSDPLGTPVVERSVTIDATTLGAVAIQQIVTCIWSTPFKLKANTNYAIAVRPTTVTNITAVYLDDTLPTSLSPPNTTCYSASRVDNAGSFVDFNGGTAKTRMMYFSLVGSHAGADVGISTSNLGM